MNLARGTFSRGWLRFWFAPEPPQALVTCRILLYGGLLLGFWDRDFTVVSVMGRHYWQPSSFARLLWHAGPPTVGLVAVAQIVWKISLATSCLGLATRFSTALAAVLGVILLQLPNDLGKPSHSLAPGCVALIVMAISTCGRTGSLDCWMGRRNGRKAQHLPAEESGWPIYLMRVVISLVFFCAGANKLLVSGLGWVSAENMQMTILEQRAGGFGLWIAQHPQLCWLMAAMSLGTEFFHPLSLFSKKAACLWVPAGFLMFTGIYFALGFDFRLFLYLHFFWLPWGRLFPAGGKDRASSD